MGSRWMSGQQQLDTVPAMWDSACVSHVEESVTRRRCLVYRCTECGLHGGIQLSPSETRETTAYGAGSLSADAHLDHSHADSRLCSAANTQSSNFSQELRSTLQEPATRNMMPHEIPELSVQQSKADNCVWAYCCFTQRLEDQRVGCYSSPGISLEGCLGVFIFLFVGLVLYFVGPFALKHKQTLELEGVEEKILPENTKTPLWNLMDTLGLVWKIGNF